MSPAPDTTDTTFGLSPAPSLAALASSGDELGGGDTSKHRAMSFELGPLSIESMESINLSSNSEDEEQANRTIIVSAEEQNQTTYSAPSTPSGERDQSVVFRTPSVATTPPSQQRTTTQQGGPTIQLEVKYSPAAPPRGGGILDSVFGCLKPILTVWGKLYEETRPTTAMTSSNAKDSWEVPFDSIMDMVFIGKGIEGDVFHGQLNGQDVACKRVKSEEETNVKHLRKLNHCNVIKFKGICVAPPLYYIIMEYCAYGSLYEVLKRRREENSCTKPTQVLDWSRQIASGVNYLHQNKIVHRDLKSPNILIDEKEILKISDFGTSKQLVNRRSQIMSFNGTTAWMSPEVIRNEPCSDKIDVWSFGIVLWEILTCEIPYQNIDPSAVMWGVGKGSLTLPIPSSAPEGFKLLMTMCWDQRPRCRPSFVQILKHLSVSEKEIILFEQEQEYQELKHAWSVEINEQLAASKLPTIDISSTLKMSQDEIMMKRREELQHIQDIRTHYQKKIQQTNTLYLELSAFMLQLQQREKEIIKKERLLNIHPTTKKRSISQLTSQQTRKKSLQMLRASLLYNVNNGKNLPPSIKRKSSDAGLKPSLNINVIPVPSVAIFTHQNLPPKNVLSPPATSVPSLPPSTSTMLSTAQPPVVRRKKGHRRTNSKGSQNSWEEKQQQQKPVNITHNMIDTLSTTTPHSPSSNTTSHRTNTIEMIDMSSAPLPSISAHIDSKAATMLKQRVVRGTLSLDLQASSSEQQHHTTRPPTTMFTYAPRKSSSSGVDEPDEQPPASILKQQRRRSTRATATTVQPSRVSPSKANSPTVDARIDDDEEEEGDLDSSAGSKQPQATGTKSRNVTFLLSPSCKASQSFNDRSPSGSTQVVLRRMTSTGSISKPPARRYNSSSEEGEVEEVHSDHYIMDDEKHRQKHEDLNRTLGGTLSSESEIYGESSNRSSSLKSEGIFSDEGGHVSDERPESRESLLVSEPEEHEVPQVHYFGLPPDKSKNTDDEQ